MTFREHIHNHIRLPGAMLFALLITVLTITGLTFVAIKGQRAELGESRYASQEGALQLLANRIEQNLFEEIQTPFRPLHSIQKTDYYDDETFSSLMEIFTDVNQILFFDAQMQLVSSHPLPNNEHEVHFNHWISERLQEEDIRNKVKPYIPHTFVETFRGHDYLYAVEPVSQGEDKKYRNFLEVAEPDSWIILRFDLLTLKTKIIMPLFNDFTEANSGHVALVGPDASYDDKSMTESLTRILPGWQVVYTPPRKGHANEFTRQNMLLISLAAGAFLAITLSVFAIWWEVRREHADVDLRNRFIANVSHELKTPLSLIRMYAETLYMRRVLEPEKQQRLSKLIENVLDFSRLRSGDEIYHLTGTNLYGTVKTVLDQYKPKFESAGLALDIFLQDNLPPVAHDPNGITQIILNLLDNSTKYATKDRPVQVRLTGDVDWVDLQVIDFGPGLSPNQHSDLVQSLRKGRLARVIRGGGIGLAMVDMIAKKHNAHLVLDIPDNHTGLKAVVSFPAYKV